jgi:hypothetical protein
VTLPPSAVAKFNRAQRHFDALRDSVDGFREPKPYRVRPEANDDFTEHRFYIDFDPPWPGAELGLLLGEGIQCLCSGLDHTIYALGVNESGTDPPPQWRQLQFPITEDAVAWSKARWRIKTLSAAAQTEIERLQPHGTNEEFFLRPLGTLEELNNADKHRALRVISCVPLFEESLVSGLVPGSECSFNHLIGPLEDATPVVAVTCSVPSPEVKMNGKPTLQVGIPWVRGNGNDTALLLWLTIDAVNIAVRTAIEALDRFC